MKKSLSLLLALLMILTSCSTGESPSNSVPPSPEAANSAKPSASLAVESVPENAQPMPDIVSIDNTKEATLSDGDVQAQEEKLAQGFSALNDPSLLLYVEDSIRAGLDAEWANDDYIIEDVSAIYVSKEYLEELEFNSKKNIYFGYTLDEIEAQFGNTRYVFTLGEDGTTVVKAFEGYDDTFNQVAKNVAIGTGVILICVTVSVVSGGLGAPAVSAVFAASAKTGAMMALSSGVISGAMSGIVEGVRTNDLESALKKAALSGSEGFKMGAITGAVTGGALKAFELYRPVPTPREAEIHALQKYRGEEQLSYLNGEEVPWGTPNATRPDVVRTVGDHLEAIEVKNYNLASAKSRETLNKELLRQVSARQANMPSGTTQRIVLNVEGRQYSVNLVEEVVATLHMTLDSVYPNIPIDIMGAMV